jgi:hypothetical protein
VNYKLYVSVLKGAYIASEQTLLGNLHASKKFRIKTPRLEMSQNRPYHRPLVCPPTLPYWIFYDQPTFSPPTTVPQTIFRAKESSLSQFPLGKTQNIQQRFMILEKNLFKNENFCEIDKMVHCLCFLRFQTFQLQLFLLFLVFFSKYFFWMTNVLLFSVKNKFSDPSHKYSQNHRTFWQRGANPLFFTTSPPKIKFPISLTLLGNYL